MRYRHILLVVAAFVGATANAAAQSGWPEKPVRIIVNFAPGGSTDNAARPFADRLCCAVHGNFPHACLSRIVPAWACGLPGSASGPSALTVACGCAVAYWSAPRDDTSSSQKGCLPTG